MKISKDEIGIPGLELNNNLTQTQQIEEIKTFFENIIKQMPCYVYWKDKNYRYMFINELTAQIMGLNCTNEAIGKTDYDFGWDKNLVNAYRDTDKRILETGTPVKNIEEDLIDKNGRVYHTLVNKLPLKSSNGEIIGILGITVDVTNIKNMELNLKTAKDDAESALQAMLKAQSKEQKHRKEAERLTIENATHKAELAAEAQFLRIVGQVFHDINSPLASLKTLEAHLSDLPEEKRLPEQLRIEMRRIIRRITDIINNLHRRSHVQSEGMLNINEDKKNILLSALLIELLSEKSLEYEKNSIEFITEFQPKSQFAFINVQVSQFSRSFSNIINNAMQAFDDQAGTITLQLAVDDEYAHITIQDNGKGMAPELVSKIENNISFTHGKKNGHGIGLGQVHDMLRRNFGKMAVRSKPGQGTAITLSFPLNQQPPWAIDSICFKPDDLVVILDDDPSIHGSWDIHLEAMVKQLPNIHIHHFESAQETIDFIAAINEKDKQKIVLLTDYELINQPLNGLDVIKQANLHRAVLVTSHYMEEQIQKETASAGAKLLPKQLVSEIAIRIAEEEPSPSNQTKDVDAVWLEDDEQVTRSVTSRFTNELQVAIYQNPNEFMQNITHYPLDTLILLDNEYEGFCQSGIDVAENLHKLGFTALTLVSGRRFDKGELPDYLNVLSKLDLVNLKDYIIKYKENKK